MAYQNKEKYKKEAPIYFSNIFISFLALAYYTPLGCLLRLPGTYAAKIEPRELEIFGFKKF